MLTPLLNLGPRARHRLRKNAPPQERRLWKEVLRKYPVGFVWKWATVPPNHVPVDFYSPELKLAIDVETDEEHEGRMVQHEKNRRTFLQMQGKYCLFITESEIDEDMEAVRRRIDEAVRERKEQLRQMKLQEQREPEKEPEKEAPGEGES